MKIVRPHLLPNGTVIFNLRLSDNVIVNGFRWSPKGLLLPPMKVNAKGKRVAVLVAPGWWYKRLRVMCEQQFPVPTIPIPLLPDNLGSTDSSSTCFLCH